MNKARILCAILGTVLIIDGGYNVYKAFGHGDTKSTVASVEESATDKATDKNGVSFSVTSVQDTNAIGENYTTANNFVIVTVKIDNAGDDAYDVNTLRFKLIADDKEYEYDADAVLYLDNAMFMDTLNPGLSKEYNIAYETPFTHTEKDMKLEILDNAFSSNAVYIQVN